VEALAEHQPDVAFLDIRMPGLTGLEVATTAAEASPRTRIVFVTAYDQYAIDAFDRGAIDYLLKPVKPERLDATVARLQAQDTLPDAADAWPPCSTSSARCRTPAGSPEPLTWLTASAGRETRLVLVDEVIYFHADQKYTTVVTADGEALLRTPLRELLPRLDPATFKQIHRSTIVNLKAVAGILRDDSGRGTLRLKHRPETLAVSQPFMALFKQM
jgi:DNA-binding LytR/AlgR family response regulator